MPLLFTQALIWCHFLLKIVSVLLEDFRKLRKSHDNYTTSLFKEFLKEAARSVILAKIRDLGVTKSLEKVRISKKLVRTIEKHP